MDYPTRVRCLEYRPRNLPLLKVSKKYLLVQVDKIMHSSAGFSTVRTPCEFFVNFEFSGFLECTFVTANLSKLQTILSQERKLLHVLQPLDQCTFFIYQIGYKSPSHEVCSENCHSPGCSVIYFQKGVIVFIFFRKFSALLYTNWV